MKSFHPLKLSLLAVIATLAFCFAVFIAQPSIAKNAHYQTIIEQGLIDGVKTPQELGLDYLQQEPAQLVADQDLVNSIYQAEQEVSVLPEDIPLRFDLGTNYPIRIGRLRDGEELTKKTCYDAVGYLDQSSGQGKSFVAPILSNMFNTEARNGGDLAITPEAQHILVADSRRKFLQAQRVLTIDLIVHCKRTKKIFLMRDVNANAVCRDALNAVFNRTLEKNTYSRL